MSNKLQIVVHSFHMGWNGAWAQKVMMFGFLMFFTVLVSVWASVWSMVSKETMERIGLTYSQMVWYFVFAELMLFSVGHLYRDIEDDIRSGQMTMFFVRPISYVLLKGSEGLGFASARATFLFPIVLLLGSVLTQEFLPSVIALVMLPIVILLGLFIWILMQIIIGLLSAWFNSARPINMIFQKTAFVLGGLIVPVTHYPELLQAICWSTPFPAIVYAPASLVMNDGWFHILGMIQMQVFWIILCLFFVSMISYRFEEHMLRKGEL